MALFVNAVADVGSAERSVRSRRNAKSRSRGQSLVELALLLPILMTMVLGIVEVGNAIFSYVSVINASREGARLVARGNIFSDPDVKLVIEEHSGGVDLNAHGGVVLTTVTTDSNGLITDIDTKKLIGADNSRFTAASLKTLHDQASSSNPGYLRKDKFAVVEVFYRYQTLTTFLEPVIGTEIPMYAYTIMPIAAPS